MDVSQFGLTERNARERPAPKAPETEGNPRQTKPELVLDGPLQANQPVEDQRLRRTGAGLYQTDAVSWINALGYPAMSRRLSRSLCLVLALGLCATAGPKAHAAEDPALQEARDKFQKALALQTGGDWAGALVLLKEVAAVRSTPQVRFNIALCEENLGQLVASVGDYELAAADARKQNAPDVSKEAEARLDALRGRIPKVVVKRGVNADAATITLDGVTLGDRVIGQSMNIDPGPHVITGRAAGFQSFRTTVRVAETQVETVEVNLVPINPPAASAPTPVDKTPEREPEPSSHTAAYIVGGIGLASFAGAGAMFYLRQQELNTLENRCINKRCDPSLKSVADRGERYTLLGNIGLGVGAAGVSLGLILFLAGNDDEPEQAVSVVPTAPNSDVGLSYLRRF